MNQIELQEKQKSLKNWLTVGGFVGAALLAGVFYMVLVQAVVGIIALGVAAFSGFAIVSFAPVVATKIANAKYRALDAEKVSNIKKITSAAAENPIETLTALLIAKAKAVEEFERNVVTATAARDTFRAKVEKFSKNYPARAPEFAKQLDRMSALVFKKGEALKIANASLREGDIKLEEMKAYWEMSKDAQALNKAAGMDTGDVFEKLKADTACDSVFESMNLAFAQLEVASLLEMELPQQAITNNPSEDFLEVSAKVITQKVNA